MWLRAFAEAWALLTAIPLPSVCFTREWGEKVPLRSAVFYPWVGGAIGLLVLIILCGLPQDWPAALSASCVLIVWIGLTGALHLDGLADSCDAYFAAHKNPAKALKVFKDPNVGAMAVVALIAVLLIKWVLLEALIQSQIAVEAILVSCVLSRTIIIPYMLTTPYVGSRPWDWDYFRTLKPQLILSCVIATGLLLFWVNVMVLMTVLLVVAVLGYGWRKIWLRKIGGYVGDSLGALVELSEIFILFVFFQFRAVL